MSDDFDQLDQLREKSLRTRAAYDGIEGIDDGGGVLSRFTPSQRLILAVLVLVDIIVIGLVLLVIFGVIDL